MNITYRKSIKEDIPYINDLFIEMIKTVNKRMKSEGITPYGDLEKGFEDGYLDTFYDNPNRVIYVALDGNIIVGFISICVEEGYIYLDDYSVTYSYRGKGIGTKLLDLAVNYAKEKNIDDILTHVESSNKESIEFYKNRGFKLVEKQENRLLIKR